MPDWFGAITGSYARESAIPIYSRTASDPGGPPQPTRVTKASPCSRLGLGTWDLGFWDFLRPLQ